MPFKANVAIAKGGDTRGQIAGSERQTSRSTARARTVKARRAAKKVTGEKVKEPGNGQTPRKVSGKEDGRRREAREKDIRAKAKDFKHPYTILMENHIKVEPGGEPGEMEDFPEGSLVV